MAQPKSAARSVVGARELKTRLGRYLRAVRGGATITVTERGQPIAHIVPLSIGDAGVDATIDDLSALGILSKGTGEPLPLSKPVRVRGEPIETTIALGREDRL